MKKKLGNRPCHVYLLFLGQYESCTLPSFIGIVVRGANNTSLSFEGYNRLCLGLCLLLLSSHSLYFYTEVSKCIALWVIGKKKSNLKSHVINVASWDKWTANMVLTRRSRFKYIFWNENRISRALSAALFAKSFNRVPFSLSLSSFLAIIQSYPSFSPSLSRSWQRCPSVWKKLHP